jgi:hypothetical protein
MAGSSASRPTSNASGVWSAAAVRSGQRSVLARLTTTHPSRRSVSRKRRRSSRMSSAWARRPCATTVLPPTTLRQNSSSPAAGQGLTCDSPARRPRSAGGRARRGPRPPWPGRCRRGPSPRRRGSRTARGRGVDVRERQALGADGAEAQQLQPGDGGRGHRSAEPDDGHADATCGRGGGVLIGPPGGHAGGPPLRGTVALVVRRVPALRLATPARGPRTGAAGRPRPASPARQADVLSSGGRAHLPSPPAPDPTTLGELRASGHVLKPVKAEVRDNLLACLAAGETAFPGILGFDDTVLPRSSGRCSPATTSSCSASAARGRPASSARSSACSTSGRRCSPAPSSTSTRTSPSARGGTASSPSTVTRRP